MDSSPILGVVYHSIGGFAAATFYLPFAKVKGWSWENAWLLNGVFSWLLAPLLGAILLAPESIKMLLDVPGSTLAWTFVFGFLWGIGGLTFGLTMRYLGLALGYAVALGFCAVFGTIIPPLFNNDLAEIASSLSGKIILLAVSICLVGIFFSGLAGFSKEKELNKANDQEEKPQRKNTLTIGLFVALFAGILSACMSFAFAAGSTISDLAVSAGVSPLWQNLPVLIVILAGGFCSNAIFCLYKMLKNKTLHQYFQSKSEDRPYSNGANMLLCAVAGVTWYLQFFFYGMGTTQMGKFDFSSWTLHMSFIIIFSTLWGIQQREWVGTTWKTHRWIAIGLLVLISSTVMIGYGTYLKTTGVTQ